MLKGFPKTTSRFKDFQEDKEGLTGLSVESAHGYDLLQQENKKRNQQREKRKEVKCVMYISLNCTAVTTTHLKIYNI